MTQVELAERVKSHPKTISALECAKFHPGLELGLRLSEALNVNIRWLAGHTDNHRRGRQPANDLEEANAAAYDRMGAEERQQFAEGMAEFIRMRNGARAKAEC